MPGGKRYKWSNRYFSDFVETMTINGVFHIFKGRSKIRQILWGLLVIGAFIGYTGHTQSGIIPIRRLFAQSWCLLLAFIQTMCLIEEMWYVQSTTHHTITYFMTFCVPVSVLSIYSWHNFRHIPLDMIFFL